ncbi:MULTISPECIES: hypothetical protein [unclassified Bradyrhizobium]|uniref:hypothetical protein n=1 Tax=unclassified Bradyrhizobium TaxID=2631580 RepID=UPI001605F064|nr:MULTISPECIES: hypothetical protein [unclassified Bradyrhizobium]MBB4363280.1 hypothetical protein [Bradyrhizobium sp. CIR18]MBB4393513.1 hypothetical protein [Bradyrhizobium sp. ERR14]
METTAFRPSKESSALDFNRAASHPPTASFVRARAARADLSQDDPIPLFLSDPLGAPDPSEYTPVELRSRIVPRVLAAVLAASTLAVLAVLYQSDFRGFFTANAGSWVGLAPDMAMASANAPAIPQTPLKDPARVSNTTLASADARDLPAPTVPSREAIATAYQVALQAQGPVQGPVQAPEPVAAQPAPPEPVRTLDADTLAALMTRAKSLLRIGDIAAARLLLERAANAQDATAALLLAQTYDPTVLGTSDARSVIADASAARDWYQRAASLGSAEARQRLVRIQN